MVAEEVSLFIVATLLQTVHISMPYFNNTTGRGEETEPSSRLDEETGIVYLSEGFGGGYVTASFKLPIGETLQITIGGGGNTEGCLLYTSPSPRDRQKSRMPSSA